MDSRMALNTGVYIHGTVDVDALFDFTLNTLLATEGQGRTTRNLSIHNMRATVMPTGPNQPGTWMKGIAAEQPDTTALPATLGMWYRKDGSPAMTVTQAEQQWRICKNGCSRADHAPAYHVLLGFSVSIFWDDDDREWNPGDFTSSMLWQVGGWLDTHKVKWSWRNELVDQYTVGYEPLESFHQKTVDRREEMAEDFFGRLNSGGVMIIPWSALFGDDED